MIGAPTSIKYFNFHHVCSYYNSYDHYRHKPFLLLQSDDSSITDPDNITLELLKHLKNLKEPAVFWVLLGESYHHRYNELIDIIRKDTIHEIILAKTNKSMWHILRNTSMAILTGGLTSYEAAYAGLPAINYFKEQSRSFLTKELEEKNLCLDTIYEIDELSEKISSYMNDREKLKSVHQECRKVFAKNPIENVLNALSLGDFNCCCW